MGFKKALEWTKFGRIWVRGPGINLEVGHQAWRFLCLESRGHLRGGRPRPRPWRGCWCWWPWPSVIRKKCLAPGNCWQPLKNEFIILNRKIIKEIFMRNSFSLSFSSSINTVRVQWNSYYLIPKERKLFLGRTLVKPRSSCSVSNLFKYQTMAP